MTDTMRRRLGAGIVFVAPLLLAAGLVSHPFVFATADTAAVADAAAENVTRWGVSHFLVGLGSGALILAFVAIRSALRDAGENYWSLLALPFVVIACTLYAIPQGMEFTAIAAAETGADVEASLEAISSWILPTMISAGVLFAIAMGGFALGIARSGMLSPGMARFVIGALILLAVVRVVPLGLVHFYLQSLVLLLALLPLGYQMLNETTERQVERPRAESPQPAHH